MGNLEIKELGQHRQTQGWGQTFGQPGKVTQITKYLEKRRIRWWQRKCRIMKFIHEFIDIKLNIFQF